MSASPSWTRFGISSERDSAICPSVVLPTSPYSAASGSSPIPTLSRTIQKTLSNSFMFPRLEHLSAETLSHTVGRQCCPAIFAPRSGRSLDWRFGASASSRLFQPLLAPPMLYSDTNRSLNYFPFACVVQDSEV